jgi:integral membrane protein
MWMNLRTYLGRLRLIGFIEGWSYLILMGLAMPLKYLADWPLGVTIVGGLHGFLFVLYCLSVVEVMARHPFGGIAKVFVFWLKGAIASLIPFGTFVWDHFDLKPMQGSLETPANEHL